jgi:2-iminobutanoate/2-iminopropanoate deaminase
VYCTYFPDSKPVRTTVESFLPKALVEIDVIAFAPVREPLPQLFSPKE